MNPTLSQIQAAAESGSAYLKTTPSIYDHSGQQAIAYLDAIADLAAFLQDPQDIRSDKMRLFLENTVRMHAAPKEQEN